LLERLSGASYGKEQFWVGVFAQCFFAPRIICGSEGKACCEN
jgi:hypothetical protein